MSNEIMTLDSLIAGLGDESKSLTKEASVKPTEVVKNDQTKPSIAEELESVLTKSASVTQLGDDSTMNTQQIGNSIAAKVLEKLAQDMENKVIEQTGELVAQQDAGTELTPVENKTVTETAKALLARGAAAGGVRDSALEESAVGDTDATTGEGAPDQSGSDDYDMESVDSDLSKTAQEDDLEKIAAVATLMDSGIDFESAVALVKEAEEAIQADSLEQVKLASVNALMSEGVDLTSAVIATEEAIAQLEKEAQSKPSMASQVTKAGMKTRAAASDASKKVTGAASSAAAKVKSAMTPDRLAKLKKGGKVAAGIAGAGAGLAAAGYAVTKGSQMAKTAAAVQTLVDVGYTIEDALILLAGE